VQEARSNPALRAKEKQGHRRLRQHPTRGILRRRRGTGQRRSEPRRTSARRKTSADRISIAARTSIPRPTSVACRTPIAGRTSAPARISAPSRAAGDPRAQPAPQPHPAAARCAAATAPCGAAAASPPSSVVRSKLRAAGRTRTTTESAPRPPPDLKARAARTTRGTARASPGRMSGREHISHDRPYIASAPRWREAVRTRLHAGRRSHDHYPHPSSAAIGGRGVARKLMEAALSAARPPAGRSFRPARMQIVFGEASEGPKDASSGGQAARRRIIG